MKRSKRRKLAKRIARDLVREIPRQELLHHIEIAARIERRQIETVCLMTDWPVEIGNALRAAGYSVEGIGQLLGATVTNPPC